jgi:hypothetical protein
MNVGWVSRLRRFVADDGRDERCDLCAEAIGAAHRHLIELSTRRILCACEACGGTAAGSARFRAIVPTTIALDDFALDDSLWDALQIPIGLAFLLESGEDRRPLAVYPSPAGGIESAIAEELWSRLQTANPALFDMTPDVEALLIHRMGAARRYYRVSIDRCYALTGLVRSRWEGLSGGAAVRREIERFFAALDDAPSQGTFVHG